MTVEVMPAFRTDCTSMPENELRHIPTIVGMLLLRAWMARRFIPYLIVFISNYETVMFIRIGAA